MTTYTPPEVETVIFNGIKYRRYPNAKRLNDRNYYRPAANYIKAGVSHLHREIWRAIHGEIPDGYQIHHKDGNPLNNRPDNLECLSSSEHAALHAEAYPDWKRKWVTAKLDAVRDKAADWHRSDEGREWHRLHGIAAMEQREYQAYSCKQCGQDYQSRSIGTTQFCSNKCKSAWRRASGADVVEKPCAYCGNIFKSHKYNHTRCCGNSCAAKFRYRK